MPARTCKAPAKSNSRSGRHGPPIANRLIYSSSTSIGFPMHISARVFPFATVFLAFALQGCGKQLPEIASKAVASAVNKAAGKAENLVNADTSWDEKANAYVSAGNSLTSYAKASRSERTARERDRLAKGDFKAIQTGTYPFDNAFFVQKMKSALSNPASMPEADAAAKNLLEVIEKYLPNWKNLADYNTAKKFEDDNGAEGRRMLVMYREGDEKLVAAVMQFLEKVDAVAREASAKNMARFKAEGKLLELYKSEALAAAGAVADTFESTGDFKNKEKIANANAQLAILEAKLSEMQAEHTKRKAASPDSLPTDDRYDSIYSYLTSFAGKYRESRTNPQRFNDAVDSYNHAVEDSNRMSH